MSPFRHLLSPNTPFEWTDKLEVAFSASKETILELIKKDGKGCILQQKTCDCNRISHMCCSDWWRLVLAGGSFCKPAEKNHSPIEDEGTSIFKGLQDTKYYTLGCQKLHVATDHQPLVNTLGKQSVAHVANKRLARIKEKTMCWRFEMIYNPAGCKVQQTHYQDADLYTCFMYQ